jgi:hypothetical protein
MATADPLSRHRLQLVGWLVVPLSGRCVTFRWQRLAPGQAPDDAIRVQCYLRPVGAGHAPARVDGQPGARGRSSIGPGCEEADLEVSMRWAGCPFSDRRAGEELADAVRLRPGTERQ